MAPDFDPELIEQSLGQGPGRYPGRRLPGASPLQDISRIQAIVLEHPGQIGVAGAGTGHSAAPQLPDLIRGLVRHHVFPIGPVAVGDQHGDRGAQRLASAESGQPLDLVALDLHSGAPAVALHSPGKLPVDPLC